MNRSASVPPPRPASKDSRARRLLGALCLASLGLACGDFASIPLIAPPVMAATPDGFTAASARLRLGPPDGFTAQAFRDRLFSGGPTDVQQLLTSIDD